MAKIEIYTDGSCDNNNPNRPMGWAAILRFVGDDGSEIAYREVTDGGYGGSNNIAELNAVIEGLKALSDTKHKVEIYTDSTYVKGALSGNKINANEELIKYMKFLLSKYNAKVFHVKGHADNEYNNKADKLAKDMYMAMTKMLPDYTMLQVAWLEVTQEEFDWMKLNMSWSRKLSQGEETIMFHMDDLAEQEVPVHDIKLASDIMSARSADLMLVSVGVQDDSQDR